MEGNGMGKRHATNPQRALQPKAQAKTVEPEVVPDPPVPKTRVIEEYRHCPICWGGNGGYGTAYSTNGSTRYYKCTRTTKPDGVGPCGHTWTATVRLEVIKVEHRRVHLDGER